MRFIPHEIASMGFAVFARECAAARTAKLTVPRAAP
jgi:hypothetical protein